MYVCLLVVYLERNELLRDSIASFDLPTVEVINIPSNEPGKRTQSLST